VVSLKVQCSDICSLLLTLQCMCVWRETIISQGVPALVGAIMNIPGHQLPAEGGPPGSRQPRELAAGGGSPAGAEQQMLEISAEQWAEMRAGEDENGGDVCASDKPGAPGHQHWLYGSAVGRCAHPSGALVVPPIMMRILSRQRRNGKRADAQQAGPGQPLVKAECWLRDPSLHHSAGRGPG
jgi:hypothetical protein